MVARVCMIVRMEKVDDVACSNWPILIMLDSVTWWHMADHI